MNNIVTHFVCGEVVMMIPNLFEIVEESNGQPPSTYTFILGKMVYESTEQVNATILFLLREFTVTSFSEYKDLATISSSCLVSA